MCVDKMDYWFRECAVTGVTAVTIWVGVTNLLAGNMVCIKRPWNGSAGKYGTSIVTENKRDLGYG